MYQVYHNGVNAALISERFFQKDDLADGIVMSRSTTTVTAGILQDLGPIVKKPRKDPVKQIVPVEKVFIDEFDFDTVKADIERSAQGEELPFTIEPISLPNFNWTKR